MAKVLPSFPVTYVTSLVHPLQLNHYVKAVVAVAQLLLPLVPQSWQTSKLTAVLADVGAVGWLPVTEPDVPGWVLFPPFPDPSIAYMHSAFMIGFISISVLLPFL